MSSYDRISFRYPIHPSISNQYIIFKNSSRAAYNCSSTSPQRRRQLSWPQTPQISSMPRATLHQATMSSSPSTNRTSIFKSNDESSFSPFILTIISSYSFFSRAILSAVLSLRASTHASPDRSLPVRSFTRSRN